MINKITFSLLAVLLWLTSSLIAHGDTPLSCCYTIQLTASQVEDCSAKAEFQPVIVTPLETGTVTLQFDTSLAGREVVVQALDGGTLGIGGSVAIASILLQQPRRRLSPPPLHSLNFRRSLVPLCITLFYKSAGHRAARHRFPTHLNCPSNGSARHLRTCRLPSRPLLAAARYSPTRASTNALRRVHGY